MIPIIVSSFIALMVVLLGTRQVKFLMGFLLAGVALRIGLIFLGYFDIWYAPGGQADGAAFVNRALEYSLLDWPALWQKFEFGNALSYSAFGGVLFKLFGYGQWLLPAVNLIFGSINIVLGGVIANRLWGRKAALIATAIIALYPFAAFNSVVALREELSILFFMVGLYVLIGWIQRNTLLPFVIANMFFVFAASLHPGWIAAPLGLALYFVYSNLKGFLKRSRDGAQSQVKALLAGLAGFAMLAVVLLGGVELGKGIVLTADADELAGIIEQRFQRGGLGGSAYPDWVATGDPISQPWLVPLRIIYFLYSPFPWDIRAVVHLTGLIGSFLYLFLTLRAWQSRSILAGKQRSLALLFMFLALTFVFALGVTNIGTAIRHKTKFFILFVLIAAPAFRKLIRVRWGG